MHACLHGRKALVTGSARQTIHTALLSSDDTADESLSPRGDDDDDDDDTTWVDVLPLDDKVCVSVISSLSATNSFYGLYKNGQQFLIHLKIKGQEFEGKMLNQQRKVP